jgi:integrase
MRVPIHYRPLRTRSTATEVTPISPWTKAVAAASVPHIRLHDDARHTCGTSVARPLRRGVHDAHLRALAADALAEGARSLARVVTIRDNSTGG